jgi:hypothetical protein
MEYNVVINIMGISRVPSSKLNPAAIICLSTDPFIKLWTLIWYIISDQFLWNSVWKICQWCYPILVIYNFIINIINMVVMQTCKVETTMMPLDFCFVPWYTFDKYTYYC